MEMIGLFGVFGFLLRVENLVRYGLLCIVALGTLANIQLGVV